jgi:hypothetical protein
MFPDAGHPDGSMTCQQQQQQQAAAPGGGQPQLPAAPPLAALWPQPTSVSPFSGLTNFEIFPGAETGGLLAPAAVHRLPGGILGASTPGGGGQHAAAGPFVAAGRGFGGAPTAMMTAMGAAVPMMQQVSAPALAAPAFAFAPPMQQRQLDIKQQQQQQQQPVPLQEGAGMPAASPPAAAAAGDDADYHSDEDNGDKDDEGAADGQQRQQEGSAPKRRGRPPQVPGQYSKGYQAIKRYRQKKKEMVSQTNTHRGRQRVMMRGMPCVCEGGWVLHLPGCARAAVRTACTT